MNQSTKQSTKKYTKIIATGSALPQKKLSNFDLEKILDTSDEWIKTRTGIRTRHIAAAETTVGLAEAAAQKALNAAEISADKLDLIIFATTTPDKIFPASAMLLQQKIGANCPAFDLQSVCAGFIYALDVADKYIKTENAQKILVVGSETLSRIVDWKDRSTAVLFGDGAGAAVLGASSKPGILYSKIWSDSTHLDTLKTSNQTINENGYITMAGNKVFKITVEYLSRTTAETLKTLGIAAGEIDWVVPHQANIRIIAAVMKKNNIPMEKVITTLEQHGNTSAASIPLALDVARRDGRIKNGDTVLFQGIGSGFSWGNIVAKF